MSVKDAIMGLREGSRIHERYEIRGLLGTGGFAAVFRAFDTEIEREVAIKVLNISPLVSQGNDLDLMLARFKREAKLSARITHPCVVQIFDFGVLDEGDNPFIIMEMLNGHDLGKELKTNGPMKPTRLLPLFVDALDALGEAHQLGIVHKDLKPSNLFVTDPDTRRESLKIVDFGIAHIGDGDNSERLTQTGYMLGTTQYMAPEYVDSQLVSPPLDVYQMGLILVEALCGQAAVDHESPWKCALMHVSRELMVPGKLMLSPLGRVLEKALAYDPKQRYVDGSAFAQALEVIDPGEIPIVDATSERSLIDRESTQLVAPAPESQEILKRALTNRMEVGDSDPEEKADDFHAAKTEVTVPTEPEIPPQMLDITDSDDTDSGGPPAPGPNPDLQARATVDESPTGKTNADPSAETGTEAATSRSTSLRRLVAILAVLVVAVAITSVAALQLVGDDEDEESDFLYNIPPSAIVDNPDLDSDPDQVVTAKEEEDLTEMTSDEDAHPGEEEAAREEEEPSDAGDEAQEEEEVEEESDRPTTRPRPRPEPTPRPEPRPTPPADPPQDDQDDEDDDEEARPGMIIAP